MENEWTNTIIQKATPTMRFIWGIPAICVP